MAPDDHGSTENTLCSRVDSMTSARPSREDAEAAVEGGALDVDEALRDCTVCIGELRISLSALEFQPVVAPPRRYGAKKRSAADASSNGDAGTAAADEAAAVEAALAAASARKPAPKRWKRTADGWFEKVRATNAGAAAVADGVEVEGAAELMTDDR